MSAATLGATVGNSTIHGNPCYHYSTGNSVYCVVAILSAVEVAVMIGKTVGCTQSLIMTSPKHLYISYYAHNN